MFVFKQSKSLKTLIESDEKNNKNEKSNKKIITNKNTNENFSLIQTLVFFFSISINTLNTLINVVVFFSNKRTRIQINDIKKIDYKKLNFKETANNVNNVYYAKQILKSHIYIIRVLHVLQSDKSYKLNYVFEFMNYKQVRALLY